MAGFGTRGGLRQVGVVRKDSGAQPIIAPLRPWNPPTDNKGKAPTKDKPRS